MSGYGRRGDGAWVIFGLQPSVSSTPDAEHAFASTLANAAAFIPQTAGQDANVAFCAVKVRERT